MTADGTSRVARIQAWLVVVLVVAFIALGAIWYGLSSDVHHRIWRDMFARPGGPETFRFFLQPAMAAIAALHDGIKDARTGRSPYFWTVLHDPLRSGGRLREGLVSTSRIILLGLGMDALYQYQVLKTFYPGEALLITIILAVVPYFLLRGPVDRIARWWMARNRPDPSIQSKSERDG